MTAYQLHIRNSYCLPPSISLTRVQTRIVHVPAKPTFSPKVQIPLSSTICLLYITIFVFSLHSSILTDSINTLAHAAVQMVSFFFPIFQFSSFPPNYLPPLVPPFFRSPLRLLKVFAFFFFFCQQLSLFRIVSSPNSSFVFFPSLVFVLLPSPWLPLLVPHIQCIP